MFETRLWSTYHTGITVRLICITWLITKLVCYKLWLSDRLFPLIPVHDALLALPSWLHDAAFILSVGFMLILLFFPNKKIAILLILLEIFSCCLDQNRWQPWEYQFLFMIGAYLFYNDEKQLRYAWQLMMAGLYFFSGLSKLNSGFIHDVWQYLVLRRWLHITDAGIWLMRAGYFLPVIEMLMGVGLLFNKSRRSAVWILFFMHLAILLWLGPAGLNINTVIWPWNILMPLLLYYIFYNAPFHFESIDKKNKFTWVLVLCWWILPWLQLGGYWDKYLSSVLYSGGVEQLYICTDDVAAKTQMAQYMDSAFKIIPCSPVISVYKWGIIEMKTAPYPEKRINKAIVRAWKKMVPFGNNRFYLYKPGFAPVVKVLKD